MSFKTSGIRTKCTCIKKMIIEREFAVSTPGSYNYDTCRISLISVSSSFKAALTTASLISL